MPPCMGCIMPIIRMHIAMWSCIATCCCSTSSRAVRSWAGLFVSSAAWTRVLSASMVVDVA